MEVYEKGMFLVLEASLRRKHKQAIMYCDIMAYNSAHTDELIVCNAYNLQHTQGIDAAISYMGTWIRQQEQQSLLGLLCMAALHTSKQDYLQALKWYCRLMEQYDVEDEHTLFNVGLCYQRTGNYELASLYYQKCLTLDSRYVPALVNTKVLQLVQLYPPLGKPFSEDARGHSLLPQRSIQPFSFEMLIIRPSNKNDSNHQLLEKIDRLNQAAKLCQQGNCQQAVKQLKVLLQTPPKSNGLQSIIHAQLGVLYSLLGQPKPSIQHYSQACQLSPNSSHKSRMLHRINRLRQDALTNSSVQRRKSKAVRQLVCNSTSS